MQSKIGLGLAAIGRPEYINVRQEEVSNLSREDIRARGMEILDKAYNLGIRYFDTAPGYGMAEQLLMDWSKDHRDIEIATKWGYTYTAGFDPMAQVHEVKEHSLEKLNEQWNQSKSILPILSTYQIHSATFETGVLNNESVLERLASLKEEFGLLIGLTTTGDNQVEVIKKGLDIDTYGSSLFDVFQVTYNIFDQSLSDIAPLLEEENKRLVIKEALANGRIFPNNRFPHYSSSYKKLKEIAKNYQVGIDAIALRFCIDSLNAYKVLSGAAELHHLTENLKAESFELSDEDIQILKNLAIHPRQYWKERKQLPWN